MRKLLGAFDAFRDREGCTDQPDVSEGLREIAESLSSARVDFLAVQPYIVLILKQLGEEFGGLLQSASTERKELGFPEAADAESAFRGSVDIAIKEMIAGA